MKFPKHWKIESQRRVFALCPFTTGIKLCVSKMFPQDFNLWQWLSDDVERPIPLKEFYYLHFLRRGDMPHHAGPHGEAPVWVRRWKEREEA